MINIHSLRILAIILITTFTNLAMAEKVNMVITAAFVSEKGLHVYKDIASYIGKQTGLNVALISGTSYKEANMLLEQGIIKVGFVCGLPYAQAHALGKVKLLAIPVVAPKTGAMDGAADYKKTPGKYYSYTIVQKDSPLKSWQDLKGKSYVFNETTSNSGYNMPRYKLVQLGAKSWQDYFSRVTVSGSHEESIRMVARGLVDASSVDSLVLDFDRHHHDPDALNVKIIETLFPGGAGIPPVVVSTKIADNLFKTLQSAFLDMHNDPEGKAILASALLTRFDYPDDHNYDDVRKMEQAAIRAGFKDYEP